MNNYQPISVPTRFSKIIEKFVHNRLFYFFDYHLMFIPNQYSFRPHRSTDLATPNVVTNSYDNMLNKLFIGIVTSDLTKAFDTVCHKRLAKIRKLWNQGICSKS